MAAIEDDSYIPSKQAGYTTQATESDDTLVVMTYNTGNDLLDPERLVDGISASNAGIVALQELSPRSASVLEESALVEYPHRILHGEYIKGKGLLSKYPIVDYELFVLASGRPYIEARLQIETEVVTVMVAHPPPPASIQRVRWARLDLDLLMSRLRFDTPTLLLGDLNFIGIDRKYRCLCRAGLTDTFHAVGRGLGLTYPTRYHKAPIPLPLLFRLDYIWVSSHFFPIASYVGDNFGSDHLPLFSELSMQSNTIEIHL